MRAGAPGTARRALLRGRDRRRGAKCRDGGGADTKPVQESTCQSLSLPDGCQLPLHKGSQGVRDGRAARLDIFAKCDILFLFILPGAAGPRKERRSMKYAFDNANLLDGTKDMRVQPGLCVLTDGETITDIVPALSTAPAGYTRIDLRGRYLLPGLINMHVHLAKQRQDPEKAARQRKARAPHPRKPRRARPGHRPAEGERNARLDAGLDPLLA